MKLTCVCLLLILCSFACNKTKTVNLYDENKVAKSDLAVVIIPNDIDISKFNDNNIDTPISSKEYELRIPKGQHTLTARYYCLWNSNSGENTLLKSAKVKINLTLEPGKTYRLTHKPLHNFAQAQEFEKSPMFNVAALNETNPNPITETTAPETPAPPPNTDKKSLDVLKFIWENSSEEDKRKFLEWVKEKN